jgi:general secretion pathway protein E
MGHDDIMTILAKHCGLDYIRVDPLNIQLEVVATILPLPYIKRLSIVPVLVTKEKVVILTSEPFVLEWLDEVREQVKREIEV